MVYEIRMITLSLPLQEALKLVSGACGWGTNLARSVSSVGEHQSEAYVSPSLPKRAETFGGFDNSTAAGHSGKRKFFVGGIIRSLYFC